MTTFHVNQRVLVVRTQRHATVASVVAAFGGNSTSIYRIEDNRDGHSTFVTDGELADASTTEEKAQWARDLETPGYRRYAETFPLGDPRD